MKASDTPIIVEQSFNSSIESVWKAITDIEQMRQWYFNNIPEFKPEAGFETQFNVQSEERNFLHKWKVTEVQYLKIIKYNWEFEGYPGKSTSAFELSKQNNLTKLKLTVETLEDFPEDIPEFKNESCLAGWKYFINNRLKDFLESK
jgi:uncharacterized protein YndB with AHSA1/START domain